MQKYEFKILVINVFKQESAFKTPLVIVVCCDTAWAGLFCKLKYLLHEGKEWCYAFFPGCKVLNMMH